MQHGSEALVSNGLRCGLAEEFDEGCTLVVSFRHHTNLCFSHHFEGKLFL